MNFFDEIDFFDEDLINQFPGQGNSSSSSITKPPCLPAPSGSRCHFCVDICDGMIDNNALKLGYSGERQWVVVYKNDYPTGGAPSGYQGHCICVPNCNLEGEVYTLYNRFYSDIGIHWVNEYNLPINNPYNHSYSRGSNIATGITLYIDNPCTQELRNYPIKEVVFYENTSFFNIASYNQSRNFIASNFKQPFWKSNQELIVPFDISLSQNIYPVDSQKFYNNNYSTLELRLSILPNQEYPPFEIRNIPIKITGSLREPNALKLNQSINFGSTSNTYIV